MHATVLRDFFLGSLSAEVLADDLQDAWHWRSSDSRELRMQDLDADFPLITAYLVRLCDAVIGGQLAPEVLEPIGFGLIASDHFLWDAESVDGARIAETLYDWSSPEVNFALTVETVRKFRHRLLTAEDQFTGADHWRVLRPAPRSSWANTRPLDADAG